MYKKYIFSLLLIVAGTQCGPEYQAKDALHAKVDSLQFKLKVSQQWIVALQEVGTLMDAIDSGRSLLRVNIVETTGYDEYVLRMKSIQKHIIDSQNKIDDLEVMLSKSQYLSKISYSATKRLRADLTAKSVDILKLQTKIERYQGETLSLIEEVLLREEEIDDRDDMIYSKKQEIVCIKEDLQQLIIQNRTIEGNGYYAEGEAIEETARRTKFAPRKKRKTYENALFLYRKALSLGVTKAKVKIKELEKELLKYRKGKDI